jgi:protein-disulfide isomerase
MATGVDEELSMQITNSKLDLSDPISDSDHVIGPTNALVAVVEYGDFECPGCRKAQPTVKLLLDLFDGQICFAYRHFPQEEFHPHSMIAAEAAECAGQQGKFWEMHDLLFANSSDLKRKHLKRYAEQLGLDVERFELEMDDHVHAGRIHDQMDGGRRSRLRATPGFFVDGRTQDVSFGMHALLDATRAALANR